MFAGKKSIIASNFKKYRKNSVFLRIASQKWLMLPIINTIIKIEFGGNQNQTIRTLPKIAKALCGGVDDLIL